MRGQLATRAVSPEAEWRARLADGLATLGVEVAEAAQARLSGYLQRLAKWNAVFNLTSVRAIDDMLTVHLLDSLAILPLIDTAVASTLLDVGSGAGLPGIPIAIARPQLHVTTVDAVAKKISFQQQVKGELALGNLTAIHARVEALTLPAAPAIVVSRAYTAIADMLVSIDRLADGDTTVIAMKGVEPTAELARLPRGWDVEAIRLLDVPGLGARRCAVILRRAR